LNTLIIDNKSLPVVCGCDGMAANEDFFHADRTADFNVLIYVAEGVIYVTEDDTDYEIRPGELLFLKAGIRHYGKRPIPKGTRWYFVHFYLSADETLERFIPDSGRLTQYMPTEYSAELPKYLKIPEDGEILSRLSALVDCFHSDDKMKGWNINSVLHRLLTEIAMPQISESHSETLADRVAEYIAENFSRPFCAAELEKRFFLSYKRLAAVFRRDKGVSMGQYQTAVRMDHACKLLRSTLLSVGEIGEMTGYGDRLYFSRRFKKYMGKSPLEYRRETITL